MWILDASNRLYILLDAFLIEVFPLYSMVFTRSYYRGPLLGVVLVDARECEPPSLDVCLPCNACISGDSLGVFQGSFGWFWSFLGRVQQELLKKNFRITLLYTIATYTYSIILYYINHYSNIHDQLLPPPSKKIFFRFGTRAREQS